jgi:hypothetical protein
MGVLRWLSADNGVLQIRSLGDVRGAKNTDSDAEVPPLSKIPPDELFLVRSPCSRHSQFLWFPLRWQLFLA